MTSTIGAGARVYLGTAAVPQLPFTTGQPSAPQITAHDVTDYLSSVNVSMTQGTVDITKLTVDKDAFFRKHIAGLNDASGSGNYGDDEAGTFERRVGAIQNGILHPNGRGKTDIIIRPHGDGAGKLQYRGVVSFTSLGANTEVETEVGGDIAYKFDGKFIRELQA